MGTSMHNEMHICDVDNGHAKSVDCWCEPVNITRHTNKWGIDVVVVIHTDDNYAHHRDRIRLRTRYAHSPFGMKAGVDEPWITRALQPFGNPPLLPPADPNERSI